MAVNEKELKQIGEVEILPRDKAEFEFNRRFEKTRPTQNIARVTVCRYFKKLGGYWVEIKPEDMVEI